MNFTFFGMHLHFLACILLLWHAFKSFGMHFTFLGGKKMQIRHAPFRHAKCIFQACKLHFSGMQSAFFGHAKSFFGIAKIYKLDMQKSFLGLQNTFLGRQNISPIKVLFNKFHRRINLMALLVTILGSRNKKTNSKFKI
jgi:hypothetical protein